MADCTTPTLSVPDLTCTADLPNWATALVASLQAAIDHVVGCVQDFAYPECDICVLKDDLVNCPLDVDMIDFADIAWGDDGAVGVMPYPPSISDFKFRVGSGMSAVAFNEASGWQYIDITFPTAFPGGCYNVHISIVAVHQQQFVTSPVKIGRQYEPIVLDDTKTASGVTVAFMSDDTLEKWVTFRYLAVGY